MEKGKNIASASKHEFLASKKGRNEPPTKSLSFRGFSGKFRRQKVKLGEATYYLWGFDRNEPGELRVGSVHLTADMDVENRAEVLTEFGDSLLEIPSDVFIVAIWKD